MIFFPFDVFLEMCVTFELDGARDNTHEDVFEALWPLYLLVICGPVLLRRQFHELCRENASSANDINNGRLTIDKTYVSSVLSTNFCNLDLIRRVKLGAFVFPFPSSPSAFSPSSSAGTSLL
jgi:hypothetical protein